MIYEDIEYTVNKYGVEIKNSYLVTDDRTKFVFLHYLLETVCELRDNRSYKSLFREWKAHNICYQHGWWKDRSRDTFFEFKHKLFPKIGFWFISTFLKERE